MQTLPSPTNSAALDTGKQKRIVQQEATQSFAKQL